MTPERRLAFTVSAGLLAFWPGVSAGYGPAKLVVLWAGALWTWHGARRDGLSPRRGPLDRPLAAAFLVLLASWAASPDLYQGLVGQYGQYAYGLGAFLLAAALYGAAACAGTAGLRGFIPVLVTAGAVCGAAAALQKAGLFPIVGPKDLLPSGRAVATLGDPVLLGAALAVIAPLAAARLAARPRAPRPLIEAALIAAGLALSVSRGAWLAALGGVAVWAALDASGPLRLWPARRRAAALAGAAAAGLALVAVGAALRPTASSNLGRIGTWKTALRVAVDRPWLGVGPDRFLTASRSRRSVESLRAYGARGVQAHAHNDALQAAATVGLPGLAAYFALLCGIVLLVRRALGGPEPAFAAAAGGALAALFLQGLVNPAGLVAIACGAALAGLLASGEPRRIRFVPGVALALCAVGLVGALWLARADARFMSARRALMAADGARALRLFAEAAAANPFETHYAQTYGRAAHSASRGAQGARRRALVEEALAAGRRLAAKRPAEAEGHIMTGTYLLVLAADGFPSDLDAAERALARANEIDTAYIPILDNRRQIAVLRGEPERAAALGRELESLRSLLQR